MEGVGKVVRKIEDNDLEGFIKERFVGESIG